MKRILLAEDDRFLRRAAQTKLEQAGFVVETAVDGEEAMAALRRGPAPDLLLLDMLMPRKDGLTVLREMNADETLRDVPVVILSNSSKDLEMQGAAALGALHYWIKSNLSLQELCVRVQGLLEQS
jgi:CheY-like chemotaxis protein